jgi:hypothetical protein
MAVSLPRFFRYMNATFDEGANAMKRRVEKAESLTENLFSLEEPWRGRFLTLVARQATNLAWDDRAPTQDEVEAWLSNGTLYRTVMLLLSTWQGREEDGSLPIH